jgi:hypothetical protein
MPDNLTYQARKGAGICTRCGRAVALPGQTGCQQCVTKQRAYAWTYYHRYVKGHYVTEDEYDPRPYTHRRPHGAPAA